MASKQTRRSISVRGTTYSLLRDFCTEHDRSMSDVVEELLGRILESGEKAPRKTVAPLIARAVPAAPIAPGIREAIREAREAKEATQATQARQATQATQATQDRAAVRVVPLIKPTPQPVQAPVQVVPRAAIPPRPPAGPARPTPVANAGRPAPTPAEKVKSERTGNDYRAIRF